MSLSSPSTGRTMRARRRLTRAGLLLTLALGALVLPRADAFSDGQVASLVLGQATFTSNAAATTATGMNSPSGVAVDPTTGKVFVADTSNSRVLRFASGAALSNGAAAEAVLGQATFTTGGSATTASGMDSPCGVAVDSAGRLWVADTFNNRVLRFDGAATKPNGAPADGVLGQATFTSSAFATTASGMESPFGVAVDSAGRLWVADTSNNRVLHFDTAASKPNGANADGVLGQATFISNAFATTPSGMSFPFGVAVDSAGRLWVADTSNNRVLHFDTAASKPNGANADGVLGQATFISNAFATTPSGMSFPFGVAVDSAGRLWVADYGNNRALRFDGAASKPNGVPADGVLGQIDFISNASATTASGMNSPFGVAVDNADNLWVVEQTNNRALRFDAPLAQTITFGALAGTTLGAAPFTVSATGGASGQPVTFSSSTSAVCTVSGTNVTIVAAGTCTITADQAGDATYSAAPQVLQSFPVAQAAQTITFGALAGTTLGAAPFTVSATGGASGQPVTFSSSTPTVCTVSGTNVTIVAAGSCTITADQAGNANYSAAPQASQSFTVAKAAQTITFATLAAKTLGDPAFSLSATASSGLPVTFSSSTPTVCTVNGSTVTLVAAGTCTLNANQLGNASFRAATPISQSFTVAARTSPSFRVFLPMTGR